MYLTLQHLCTVTQDLGKATLHTYLCSSGSKKLMNWIDVTRVNLTETKPALAKVKIHSFGKYTITQ